MCFFAVKFHMLFSRISIVRTPTNFSFLLAWAPTCAIPSFVTSKRGDTVGIKMTARLYPQYRPLIIWGRSTVCNGLFRKYFVDNMWMVNCERLMPSKCRPHIKNVDMIYTYIDLYIMVSCNIFCKGTCKNKLLIYHHPPLSLARLLLWPLAWPCFLQRVFLKWVLHTAIWLV